MNPTPDRIPELEAMRLGVDYTFNAQIRAFKVRLRPITIAEHQAINQEVLDELMAQPESMRNSLSESYLLAKKIIVTASNLDPGSGRVGPVTDYLVEKMTVDEVLCLYKQWEDGVEMVNPRLEDLSAAQVEALVEVVKKNPSALTGLSFVQLVNMVRSLLTKSD